MSQELLRGTFQVLDLENKDLIQLFFNLNRIRDIVAKALRSANQGRVTANSHALSFSIGLRLLHTMNVRFSLLDIAQRIYV